MKKENLKYLVAIILIIIFTFSVVPKTFQNDTFYIIELGKCISENGVDWQDHYSIHDNLEYRYPHWAFDVINNSVYNVFGFDGIYVLTGIFASIFILLVFWNMLRKEIHFNLAFVSTLIVSYMMRGSFCARGQIVSFSLFLLEFVILENFVERPTFFKTLALFVLSCIMANVHSTAWVMMLILMLPFIGEQIMYIYSLTGINERLLKKYKKNYKKQKDCGASNEELEKIEKQIKEQEDFKQRYGSNPRDVRILIRNKPNIKYIWVAFLALVIGALITPLKLTPMVYVIKTSLGNTLGYINEHLPIIPANNLEIFSYSIIMVALLGFTKSKMKLSDAFLVLGLYLMTLSSKRNIYLLVGLTAGIIVKMIDDFIKDNAQRKNEKAAKVFFIVICIASILISIYMFYDKRNVSYIAEDTYPVSAIKYIKNNLDYKNIRFYNKYDYGSYLLMEGVPVFLDSRCDLYTPEFNEDVTVFDDYMEVQYGQKTMSSLMDKYELEYAIVPVESFENVYMEEDERYTSIYEDKAFVIYKYEK